MSEIVTRPKSSRRALAATILGLTILGGGAALIATATPAKADTWVYDGAGRRMLVRERYWAPPPVYYTPAYDPYNGYYYGHPYYAYPAGVSVGVPGFHVGVGF